MYKISRLCQQNVAIVIIHLLYTLTINWLQKLNVSYMQYYLILIFCWTIFNDNNLFQSMFYINQWFCKITIDRISYFYNFFFKHLLKIFEIYLIFYLLQPINFWWDLYDLDSGVFNIYCIWSILSRSTNFYLSFS